MPSSKIGMTRANATLHTYVGSNEAIKQSY